MFTGPSWTAYAPTGARIESLGRWMEMSWKRKLILWWERSEKGVELWGNDMNMVILSWFHWELWWFHGGLIWNLLVTRISYMAGHFNGKNHRTTHRGCWHVCQERSGSEDQQGEKTSREPYEQATNGDEWSEAMSKLEEFLGDIRISMRGVEGKIHDHQHPPWDVGSQILIMWYPTTHETNYGHSTLGLEEYSRQPRLQDSKTSRRKSRQLDSSWS